MTDCHLLTENGDKCGDPSIITKEINGNCKGYCKGHLEKIIKDLRKTYDTVYIDDKKYEIDDIEKEIIVNGKPTEIKDITDDEFVKLLNSSTVTVNIIMSFKTSHPLDSHPLDSHPLEGKKTFLITTKYT